MKKFIFIESVILFILVIAVFFQLIGFSFSRKVIFTSYQPYEINYKSYDPYCISIIKQRQIFTLRYYIYITKKIEPSYGYIINYPDPFIIDEQELKNIKINWMKEGIEIETCLNTKLFIPKKNFIGGR